MNGFKIFVNSFTQLKKKHNKVDEQNWKSVFF